MGRGAWQATVHWVAKSWTRLKWLTMHIHVIDSAQKWQPTPAFLPGESQGWGSLVGFRLWGRTESDMTEVTSQQQQQCFLPPGTSHLPSFYIAGTCSHIMVLLSTLCHSASNSLLFSCLSRSPDYLIFVYTWLFFSNKQRAWKQWKSNFFPFFLFLLD